MLKKLFLAALILFQAAAFTGCKDDEPETVTPVNPVNPKPDDPDEPDDPTPDEPDKPDTPDDPNNGDNGSEWNGVKEVVVNADGTTSDGSHFRRISDTRFVLDYVEYQISSGHICVSDYDATEIGLSLNGRVDLYSKITIDNASYNVREIWRSAFRYCRSLKEINIPNSISSIGDNAFEECTSLEKISLPNNITNIPEFCFYKCTSLKNTVLPQTLKTIGRYAFYNCSSLIYIDIPEGVEEVNAVFPNCDNLIAISLPSTLKSFNQNGRPLGNPMPVKYIYCKASTPPTRDDTDFYSTSLFVANAAVEKYESSRWILQCHITGVDINKFDFEEYLRDRGVVW